MSTLPVLVSTYGARVALVVALVIVLQFFHEMLKVRLLFYRLRRQGLPMPKWDFVAGNLRMIPGLMKRHPKGSQQSEAFTLLSYEFSNFDNCFYIDVWPFTKPLLVEAQEYVEVLREHARKGDTFLLDRVTCDYVLDIIGHVAMKARLHCQRGYNPLAAALRSQWLNGRTMNHYIGIELDKRCETWRQQKPSIRGNSIIDIVLAEYMSTLQAGATLDPGIYLLSKYPDILSKVRTEHDAVFGTDISSTAGTVKQYPELINRLPYTLAIIKETLRLFPAASALREGQPGVYLQDKNGTKYPTEGLCIWVIHGGIQRNPNYWPDPHVFKPERWLVGPGHPLYPPKGAWRPFEQGIRDCIGQALALVNIKITLVLILREFNFQDQYAEWDCQHPRSGPRTVFGERAYQIPQVHFVPINVIYFTSTLSGGFP
ncbi:cytochrome P450 [Aspergillus pseudonomiae]|uniref:Cytochrome P450 n=1 Tax=Aspergillus pseudonomiae TaxID=1506151 RepID=A0A5N7D969_9EURO|nr:cytochrome P450 [Aspergillus pseudonomiae]KAE8402807.1 cytochrome P450 [Aspergillus pseudonomiae]